MNRILIDCTKVDFARQPTGIPRVVLKYVEGGYEWAESSGNQVIPVVPTKDGLYLCRPVPGENAPNALIEMEEASRGFDTDQLGSVGQRKAPRFGTSPVGVAVTAVSPPHLIQPRSGDVLFAPAYWHDNNPRYYVDARRAGAKIAILVHDILPITYKHYYHSPWRYEFAAATLQTFLYADLLLTVSDTTKKAIEAFALHRGKRVPPIEVALNGFEDLVSPKTVNLMREGIMAPHIADPDALKALASDGAILMVGSIEPKKGHVPVIKTLEAMWAAGYTRNLVIIGRTGWLESDIVAYIEQSPYYKSRLFWLSGIDDYDLAYAYVRSYLLIFASIAEGFGIPMIEASSLCKPVVVLDTPIAHEILGDHGHYFKESSALVRTLMELEEPDTYRRACEKAAEFKWPTWDECVPWVFDRLATLASSKTAIPQDL